MLQRFKFISIIIMAILYIHIGIKHFSNVEYFLNIMPPYLPFHIPLVYISGFFEVLFGFLLLFKKTRRYASIGLIMLLILVFPANIYLVQSLEAQLSLGISKSQALMRLPFQIPLVVIAYWHSQNKSSIFFSWFCISLFFPTLIYFLSL